MTPLLVMALWLVNFTISVLVRCDFTPALSSPPLRASPDCPPPALFPPETAQHRPHLMLLP